MIVEILSDSTAKVDRTKKKELYQNIFRTPDYFWFDPVSLEFQGLRLFEGIYQLIDRDVLPWLKSKEKSFERISISLLNLCFESNKIFFLFFPM